MRCYAHHIARWQQLTLSLSFLEVGHCVESVGSFVVGAFDGAFDGCV